MRKILYLIFALVVFNSIFQLYLIKIGNSYFSINFLSIFLLVPLIFNNLKLLKWKPLFFLCLIIVFSIFSFLWSMNLKFGLKDVVNYLIFLIIVISTYAISIIFPLKKIIRIFNMYFILVLGLVFMIILFRINPIIKIEFLYYPIAKIFINPNIIQGLLDGAIRNNIFDPSKSGGFFVNANVAAAFLGINTFISYGFSKAYSISWLKFITYLYIIGIFFTGSKAGIILVIFLFIVIKFILINKHLTLEKILYTMFFINVVYILFLLIGYKFLNSNFIHQVEGTLSIRELIWDFGLSEFIKHPLLGLGFGGWSHYFSIYAMEKGVSEGFPPHNTLIFLWSKSGIIVVLFALLFMFYIIKYAFSLIKSQNKELIGLGIALFGAFSWTFIHGMGTNFGLVGESHMEIILAVLLGYSLARFKFYTKGFIYNAK